MVPVRTACSTHRVDQKEQKAGLDEHAYVDPQHPHAHGRWLGGGCRGACCCGCCSVQSVQLLHHHWGIESVRVSTRSWQQRTLAHDAIQDAPALCVQLLLLLVGRPHVLLEMLHVLHVLHVLVRGHHRQVAQGQRRHALRKRVGRPGTLLLGGTWLRGGQWDHESELRLGDPSQWVRTTNQGKHIPRHGQERGNAIP